MKPKKALMIIAILLTSLTILYAEQQVTLKESEVKAIVTYIERLENTLREVKIQLEKDEQEIAILQEENKKLKQQIEKERQAKRIWAMIAIAIATTLLIARYFMH